jgi:glycosyltransferase involved in cell wall biosynthesis
MIVKNESKVILRCLESVRPIVDYVLVEDTGSTDGTQNLIRQWLERVGLPGEVYDEPWRNFGYNRSHALARLREQNNIDYALILDADDQFVFDQGFDIAAFKSSLTRDLYEVELVTGASLRRYRRPQICSNRREFLYRGVLHEFIDTADRALSWGRGKIKVGSTRGFYISSTRQGARNQDPDKYRKDAQILEKALAEETDEFLRSRHTFYLARSYRDTGEKEKALSYFLKRAKLGFWVDEVYISLFTAGLIQQEMGKVDDALATYRRASVTAPNRAEAWHAASRLCRESKRFAEGYECARRGLSIPLPSGGLFVEPWRYEYGLLDELAVNAFWIGKYQESFDASQLLLREGKMPQEMLDRVKKNVEFAAQNLTKPTALDTRQQSIKPVFIHAAPRTSSTWFWLKFRELPSTLCFYEPFNHSLNWMTPDRAARLGRDSWHSRHPKLDPYYREYTAMLREGGGVKHFTPAMPMQWYLPEGGLHGKLRPSEKDYFSLLIESAREAGKIAVFGDCWSLGRIWAIKQAYNGFHIFQYRNLWQQWLSYVSYKRRNDLTFYNTTVDIIWRDDDPYFQYLVERGLKHAAEPWSGAGPKPSSLHWNRTYENIPRDAAKVRQIETLPEHQAFALFMGLQIYLYLNAQLCADLQADVTRMARDESYRAEIHSEIARKTGLPISFADIADVPPQTDVEFDRASIDWDEIREYGRVAADMLSKYGDPARLAANAKAFIADTIEEMRRADAKPAAPAMPAAAATPPPPVAANPSATSVKTIGLCMIVKNETNLIRRCLESVLPLVDYILVVDTGSTDGTQQMIRDFLTERKIDGAVIDEPWRDFAYNRSSALAKLREIGKIDYAMIIDADDVLEIDAGFDPTTFKEKMTADLYDVPVRHGSIAHHRPQLFSNRLAFSFKGVLHEYLEGPPGDHKRETVSGFAVRASTGGARSQNPRKYQDDAAVLERALATETDPFLISRYTFYLAQSYRDGGEKEKALENYLKRAELGYWNEEIYVSLFEAGSLMAGLGRPFDEAIATWERASKLVPGRAEALHAASRYCRDKNKYVQGTEIARRGIELKQPTGLFVQPWVYDYGILDEFAVNGYWAGAYRESLDATLRLLASDKLPASMVQRIAANARFAAEKLPIAKAPELGRLGKDDFIQQHSLVPGLPLRSRVKDSPRVLVAILARSKEQALPLYLECVEALDYPKSSIVLHIRTNNNTDQTEQILRDWVARVGHLYHSVEFDGSDFIEKIEQYREHEWNATRFSVLARIRNQSMRRAIELECDYYFVADVDNFIRPAALRELVALDLPIASPFLRSIGPGQYYSNYHAEIDDNGFFRNCDQYYWILSRHIRGVVEVPVVHCTYLVRADVIPQLTCVDASGRHEYVVFCESARKANIPQYLDNRQIYGYITFGEGHGLHVSGGIERARLLLKEAAANTPAIVDHLNLDTRLLNAGGRFILLLLHPRMKVFLDHVVEMLEDGLKELGFETVVASEPPPGFTGRAIILGANWFAESVLSPLARDSIIFNVENVESQFMTDEYRRLLKMFSVWDYNAANAARLSEILGEEVRYAKLFYVERLSRISHVAERDIDVLFYGSFNSRRSAVLDELRARGLRVEAVFGVYGASLDALIARAKVVINIHFYENGHLEVVRLFDLLANKCAVVSELNTGEMVDADLADALVLVPYDGLVEATEALVRDASRRDQLMAIGYRKFAERTANEVLPQLLASVQWEEHDADAQGPREELNIQDDKVRHLTAEPMTAHPQTTDLQKPSPKLTIYCVAYRRYEKIPVLIYSLMCQTYQDFRLVVIHDGDDARMRNILSTLREGFPDRLDFVFTDRRFADYGHSLRALAIEKCDTEFMMLTNDDNYYAPTFLELMFKKADSEGLDLVLCDMVHSHNKPGGRPQGSYEAFHTEPSTNNADIGCFILKTELAKRVGFRDKGFAGDGTFIDDVMNKSGCTVKWGKVDKILFVHN